MGDAEVADLSAVLKRATSLYYHCLDDAPFNIAWYTCPVRFDAREECMYRNTFHWYISLFPRLKVRIRGLQSATDVAENKMLPEDDGAQLRQWLVKLSGE